MSDIGVNINGISVAGDLSIRDVTVGCKVEELVSAMQARGLLATAEFAGLQRRVVISIAQRLRADVTDFDQALAELEAAVEIALEVIQRGERGTNEDAFVNSVLAIVAAKVRQDDLDGSAAVINEALAELDAQHQRSMIALLEESIKIDTLRRDAGAIARQFERSVALGNPGVDRAAWSPEFHAKYDSYFNEGQQKGNNFALKVAIELSRRILYTAKDADEIGQSLIKLGNALLTLGERESKLELIQESIKNYRLLLDYHPRESDPFGWATVQNNLGNSLRVLGERENGTKNLLEAVQTFRLALQELSRDHTPLDWARTQHNLGSALHIIGKRETGTERIAESVQAYREALEERTRRRAPHEWAMTQNNLGNALTTLGGRETGTEHLEEAVQAYRDALEERTRDLVPLQWATTQNNLGNVLYILGEREPSTERCEEALQAYYAALQERTRERVPLDWAMTQNNLGNVLQTLGRRETSILSRREIGMKRLQEAVQAYRAALEERTPDRVPLQWAGTQNNLGNALTILGEQETSTLRLNEAVRAFHAALSKLPRDFAPLQWAETQGNLGKALWILGKLEAGTRHLRESIEAFDLCLEIVIGTWHSARLDNLRECRDQAKNEFEQRNI